MHMKATVSGSRLSDLAGPPPPEDWKALGNALRLRIINRTRAKGVDADGNAFAPYSEGYAKFKAKKGGTVGGGRVNLTGVGGGPKMLNDITFETHPTGNPKLILYFASGAKAKIALYHMGEGRVDREFFALSQDDLDYGVEYLRKRWARRSSATSTRYGGGSTTL